MELVARNGNLFSFFFDRVRAARANQNTVFADETEFYLVSLLVKFLRTRSLVVSGGRRVDEEAFALRLLGARADGDGARRLTELRHLADSTLYLLGFFRDSFRRSSVDLSYYARMGEAAYGDLAVLAGRKSGSGRDSMFGELSDKFGACVEVLAEVSESEASRAADVVGLYEEYLAFGGERTRRRLAALGVHPVSHVPGTDGGVD